MANSIDDVNGNVLNEGREVNVIAKQIPVKVGFGSTLFEVLLWFSLLPGIILLILQKQLSISIYVGVVVFIIGLIVPISYLLKKVAAGNYLMRLEQKIQHDASQIDNYLEQRVQILQNTVGLLNKSVDLDKSVFSEIAALRSHGAIKNDADRNEVSSSLSSVNRMINVAVEAYPNLQSHETIRKAMNDNSYLQKEITAAREVYNDAVLRWNSEIFSWPCKQIVAARKGYTTRIPFAADKETKERARSVFF